MVTIVETSARADMDDARRLMRAFVAWAQELSVEDRHMIDRYFDPAAFDAELENLPGKYAPPDGRLLLAREGEVAVGCVALRPLEPGVCEMKRMFVEPAFHGRGIGLALATRLIELARDSDHRIMRLDTSRHQAPAIALYQKLGFRRIPAYYPPPAGSEGFLLFFEKDLTQAD
ncbi:MAG: GNAT family N-acetyltransferase [Candidatus Devosia phytovorans]|uniref:GNAT family N-acetyltransferase n=1 Tax=Candidatus Devosia phytovorans TaxID=3121372 RepID=A0AAJ6B152_9HYPH|nr:GNAT family N-acetyltransferase [Devosia sp.]WEK05917.1 MAG: GNAT family N-acetyltransferase [Devosia sp.]